VISTSELILKIRKMTILYAVQGENGVFLASDLLVKPLIDTGSHYLCEKIKPNYKGDRIAYAGYLTGEEHSILYHLPLEELLSTPLSQIPGCKSHKAREIFYVDVNKGRCYTGGINEPLKAMSLSSIRASVGGNKDDKDLDSKASELARILETINPLLSGRCFVEELSRRLEKFFLDIEGEDLRYAGYASYLVKSGQFSLIHKNLGRLGLKEFVWEVDGIIREI